jgi:hypothetical protein
MEIREMILEFDDKGSMAFEEAPGTWIKHKDEKSGSTPPPQQCGSK